MRDWRGEIRLVAIGALLLYAARALVAQDLPDWFRSEQKGHNHLPWEDEKTGYVSGYDDRHQPTLPTALPFESRYLIADEVETAQTESTSSAPPPTGTNAQPSTTTTQTTTTETQESTVPAPPATFEGGVPGWMNPQQSGGSSNFQGAVPAWMEQQQGTPSSDNSNGSTIPQAPATFDGSSPSWMDQNSSAAPSTDTSQPWMVGEGAPPPAAPVPTAPPPAASGTGTGSGGTKAPTPPPPASSTPRSEVIYQPTTSPEQANQQSQVQVIYPPKATPAQQAQETAAKQGYRINFQNVPIIEYIRWVGQISRTNFIYQPEELNFSVTIVSEEPTSVENIMAALLQVLRVHGLSMAEQGNNILIYQDASLAALSTVVDSAEQQASPDTPPIITRVYRVYNANPSSLAGIITPLLSTTALVEVSPDTGHLVVTDIKANVDRVSELLQALDNPKIQIEIVAYHVQYADPTSLSTLVQKIMKPIASGQPFEIVPNVPGKTIFVMSTPYLDEQAIGLLEKLDVPASENLPAPPPPAAHTHIPQQGGKQGMPPSAHNLEGTNFEIYKLQYNDGDDMVTSLREIATSLVEAGGASSELVQTIRTIQWIKPSNSLVISGTVPAINQVVELLEQIDVPLKQVLIEMLIIQCDLTNSLGFGVSWTSVAQAGADFSGAIASNPAGTGTFTNPNVKPNFPAGNLGLVPGLAANAIGSLIHYNTTHFWSIQALVSAIEAENNMEVITNQKLLVQDSKTASVFVGQQIAFSEGTIAFGEGSDFATSSFDYRDIGTSMEITPYIGNGPIITLEISQEISETLTPVTGNNGSGSGGTVQNPTTDKTTTSTRVHVPDRHFLILSGQIRGENQLMRSGLPCLGSLPIISGVFSNTSEAVIKNNLIIFIRPQIVATVSEMIELTREQRHQFEEWNTMTPLHLNLREWLNLPDTCRPVNMPPGRCDPTPCLYP